MDERRDLDDLLISDEEALKSTQSKKMALVIAAAIVLFAMVIFSVYALTREEEQAKNIIPNATLEKIEEKRLDSSENPVEQRFQQVPLQKEELSNDDKFERIVREIKARQNANAVLPTPPTGTKPAQTPSVPIPDTKTSSSAPTLKPSPKPTQSTNPQKSVSDTKPIASKPVSTPKKEKQTATIPPKVSVADPFKNVKTTPVNSVNKEKDNALTKGYYVQVGSFTKFSPSGSFAKKIEQNHLAYKTQREKLADKEMIRVLVGPYASRTEANNALELIKEKVEPKAFIKHIQ